MQGNPSPRRFRALNVLEELDQPGEFLIERATGMLYLWPPDEMASARITLATLDAPVLELQNASFIALKGFVVESGLANGIDVSGGSGCELVHDGRSGLRRSCQRRLPPSPGRRRVQAPARIQSNTIRKDGAVSNGCFTGPINPSRKDMARTQSRMFCF